MENYVKLAKMRASIALLAVSGVALAGCASGARGGEGGGNAAENELLQVTPAATGEVDAVGHQPQLALGVVGHLELDLR